MEMSIQQIKFCLVSQKTVLKEIFVALNTQILNQERKMGKNSQINFFIFYLREQEIEEIKFKLTRRKEIIIRVEINKRENRPKINTSQ